MTARTEFTMPLISVVMSVYNAEKYLAEAMDSVLAQTLGDFEFVIIDDGSTDGSLKMLQDYAKRDPRIKLKARENKGLTATLNECIGLSTGEFIARMDPDDVALPARFERQIDFLRANPDVTVLGSRVILIDPFGTEMSVSDHPLTHEPIDQDLMRGIGWAIVHPVAMIRRSAIEKTGLYNEKYRTSQDLEYWLRLAETGRLANIAEPLLKYRQHLESANFAKAEQQKKLKLQIMTEAYARRGIAFDAGVIPPPPLSDAFEVRKRWGWAAVRVGQSKAARAHAWANIKARPASLEMWKMLYCSLRGR